MTDADIMQELTEIARETLLDDDLVLTRDMWGSDIVGWSSIMLVEMVLAAQERFNIRIPADEADKFRSMGDFADFVAAKTASK